MTLVAFQRALAALFVSDRAREEYARDPSGFIRRYALSEREALQIEALSRGPIEAYARTLDRKRGSASPRSRRRVEPLLRTVSQYFRRKRS